MTEQNPRPEIHTTMRARAGMAALIAGLVSETGLIVAEEMQMLGEGGRFIPIAGWAIAAGGLTLMARKPANSRF